MGIIIDLLISPVLGPIKGLRWLAEKTAEAAQGEMLDEGRARAKLLELQTRLDMGEITEVEYAEQEMVLLEWLNAIRQAKAERDQ